MVDSLNVSPTRSQLIEIRQKHSLATKGYQLLKKKQDVLIYEFLQVVKDYKQKRAELIELLKQSYKALSLDIAYTGIFVSRSLSYATQPHFDIAIEKINIMGVQVPKILVENVGRELNHTYDNSPLVSEATRRFHHLFEKLIDLSNTEQSIKSLSEEIKRIRRRVNSLEHIQLPRLASTISHIRFVLEEQERDNFIRLKTIKKRLDAKQES